MYVCVPRESHSMEGRYPPFFSPKSTGSRSVLVAHSSVLLRLKACIQPPEPHRHRDGHGHPCLPGLGM